MIQFIDGSLRTIVEVREAERAALPRMLRGLAAAGAPDARALASLWERVGDLAVLEPMFLQDGTSYFLLFSVFLEVA